MTQAQEEKIAVLMKSLDLTKKEAIELMLEDEEVDLMSNKEVQSDLTKEQKEAIKKSSKDRSGKYEKSAEALAAEEAKRQAKKSAMEILMDAVDDTEVIKDGREFTFKNNSVKYRCTIVRVRKQDV